MVIVDQWNDKFTPVDCRQSPRQLWLLFPFDYIFIDKWHGFRSLFNIAYKIMSWILWGLAIDRIWRNRTIKLLACFFFCWWKFICLYLILLPLAKCEKYRCSFCGQVVLVVLVVVLNCILYCIFLVKLCKHFEYTHKLNQLISCIPSWVFCSLETPFSCFFFLFQFSWFLLYLKTLDLFPFETDFFTGSVIFITINCIDGW